jgi:glycine oxidase
VSSPDVIVVGAGVLGLCTAAELGARGLAVTVLDPGGANASSVAAGMIAPAMESLIDDLSPAQAALLTRARDLWPAFAARHGVRLHREGAEWRGPDPDAAVARLGALGFAARRAGEAVLTTEDWRVEPGPALDGLSRADGVTREAVGVSEITRTPVGWSVGTANGQRWSAPHLVIATGASRPLRGLPPEVRDLVALIVPIRGQLTPVACEAPGRVIRVPGLYAAPTADGVLGGATMEPGERSLTPDPELALRQAEGVIALLGRGGQAGAPRVGVRGASPDGLPMAGGSGPDGLHLALAPRRNGWLLGPLVGRVVADGIEGRAPVADAVALDPLRFG